MIFEAFGQADESVSRRFGGAGLGLAICMQIVNLMQGRLWLTSEEGQGSTFYFSIELPVASAAALSAALARPGRSMGRPAGQSPIAGAHLRILVAEDNTMNQRLIQELLRRAGHRVKLVGDGRAALDQLALEHFDLVLMDVQMPGMDGIEAVKLLRAREVGGSRRVPVVALTAQAMNGDAERCLEAGMDSYITKPFDLVELEWVMLQMLSEKPAVEPLGESAAPYDRMLIERRIGRDPHLFAELCGLFEPRAEVLLAQIERAIEAREPEPLNRGAHELKSMLQNLAATDALSIARELERAGRSDEYEQASDGLVRLRREVARLLVTLRTDQHARLPSLAAPGVV
jgi:CheY-like chemotaxis protein